MYKSRVLSAEADVATPASGAPEPLRAREDHCRLGPRALALYNAFYWPYLLGTCALLFFPALVLRAFTFWDPKRKLLSRYTSLWGGHYLARAPFAGVNVQGAERVRGIGACVYVVNHQSMVDILALFATELPYLWVSKVENFYVPFLGWNMWLNGYVALRRGFFPSILRMLRTCLRRLDQGHSLCVFPEGTRSDDGNLIRFHRGAFWLAARKRVPIVPVVVEGTGAILRKKSLQIRPQPVFIRVLEPIDPKAVNYDDRLLRDRVRTAMAVELAELRAERSLRS